MEENFLLLLHQGSTKIEKLMRGSHLLNEKQCLHISSISSMVVEGIRNVVGNFPGKIKLGSSVEDLYRIMKRIEVIIKDCGRVDWVHASLWQMDNEEEFRDVLDELKCNFDTICGQLASMGINVDCLQESINFTPINILEVEKDQKVLMSRLLAHIERIGHSKENQDIVKHAHKRMICRMDGEGLELDAVNFPTYDWSPKLTMSLGSGAVGQVFMAKCFGVDVALKAFKKVDEESTSRANANFKKEVGILAGLSHPNIIKFICCGDLVDNENFGQYIAMEKMDENLADHMDKEILKSSYLVQIDIMMQIARGMFYLHDMNVAHRDLKPENVLVKCLDDPKLNAMGYVKVKLVDFGISKIEAKDVDEEPTAGKYGTTGYRAPETYVQDGPTNHCVNAFKSDVFSFAMLCSSILTGTPPFQGIVGKLIKKNMEVGVRPKLPYDCPESLASLVKECWCLEPTGRPTFEDIFVRLGKVKKELLKNTHRNLNGSRISRIGGQGGLHFLQAFISCFRMWCQVMLSWMRVFFWFVFGRRNDVGHVNSHVVENIFGMEEKKVKVMRELVTHPIVVIVGMGGMGKTTLAKFVMYHTREEFDISCFTVMKGMGSLERLKEILSNLGGKTEDVIDIAKGRSLLEKKIMTQKTLMVLDDIGSVDEIHDMMNLEMFKAAHVKNKMIITTRDWGVVESLEGARRVDLDEMNENDAMNLFTSHVCDNQRMFELPSHVVEIARRIVESCRGLPLSLKVVGSTLCGMDRTRIWMRTLQRLRRARSLGLKNDEEIWHSLKVSFDDLQDEEDKHMFLDICCFFSKDLFVRGMLEVETTLQIWSNVNKKPRESLKRLEDKSLVKISKDGGLEMHDQLRDMGRMIVQSQPDYIRTRLWNVHSINWNEEIAKDMRCIESLSFNEPTKELKYMDMKEPLFCLRLFKYQGCESGISIGPIVNNSKALSCLVVNCEQQNMPIVAKLKNPISSIGWEKHIRLQVLEIHGVYTLEALPKSIDGMVMLREMTIRNCYYFQHIPQSIGCLSSLRKLNLSGCERLVNIPFQVGNLASLTNLDLSGCERLHEIPEALGNLASLTNLDLSRCEGLKEIPKSLGNLALLTNLDLSYCKGLKEIPEALGNLTSLTNLDLSGCKGLKEIPDALGNLGSLTNLDLSRCEGLKEIPKSLGNLALLTNLDLSYCKGLKEIPEALGNLASLTNLNLSGCTGLKEIPKSLGNLASLTNLDLSYCEGLKDIPEALGNLASLTNLNLNGCQGLKEIPEALGNLASLTNLNLSGCQGLKEIPEALGNLASLTDLYISGCEGLKDIPEALGNLASLTNLDLSGCEGLKEIPKALGNLAFLTNLNLSYCGGLKEIPEALGNLASLTNLGLTCCEGLKEIPKSLGNLAFLTNLNLSGCQGLQEIPEALGNLALLTNLDLSYCKGLKEIPEALGNLTSLTNLDLSGCKGLKEIPDALGNLGSLTNLDLSGCKGLKEIPEALGNLGSLTNLDLSGCKGLKEIPKGWEIWPP